MSGWVRSITGDWFLKLDRLGAMTLAVIKSGNKNIKDGEPDWDVYIVSARLTQRAYTPEQGKRIAEDYAIKYIDRAGDILLNNIAKRTNKQTQGNGTDVGTATTERF